jgi:hypothetical protein
MEKINTSTLLKVLGWTKYIYMLCIPWMGYLAIAVTGAGPQGLFIGTGWLLVVIYQLFLLGAHKPGGGMTVREVLLALLSPVILAVGQFIRQDGSLWNFFIEDSLTELVAMNVGLVMMFARAFRTAVTTEKRSIGPAVPGVLILIGFTGAVLYCLFKAWMELNPHRDELSAINLGVAFLTSVWSYFSAMKRGAAFNKEKEPNIGLVIGQIFIWLLAMPIVMAIQSA